ncbi:helix-turn-helix transcriptional regulator [Mesorhizobium sp. IMUNJ 23232]|uniref:helix-turn-helix transcriptional regulator n=1 Tax=Mesorhizobium sp. IMUNJ 23232 TaxID=3376064 RepID=UPI0037A7536F
MSVHYFTTPKGEEMAILPRAELEELRDMAARTREVADYRAGRAPGFSPDEALAYASAASPLAFFRKRAGLTQGQLADKVGVAQGYLSDVENGKRDGPVALWLKLAGVLEVPVNLLADGEE